MTDSFQICNCSAINLTSQSVRSVIVSLTKKLFIVGATAFKV